MPFAQHFHISKTSSSRSVLMMSALCLSLFLSGCNKNESTPQAESPKTIELISQDLVAVKTGTSIQKSAFTGTIRAVNQSSIQAQVSATATSVNAQVGDNVAKGQVLVRLNNQDNAARLAQARANLASTQAQANQARNIMQRKKRLLDQGFISKVEYEQSQVDYQAQVENVRAQQANVDIAVKADRDGIITQRQVEPGQTVAIGQTLFEIVNPNQLEIQARVPSEMQSSLRLGSKIEYQIQGNPNTFTAAISRVSPIADQASRQIEFFARPNESIPSLSIGSFVEGNILSSQQVSGQIIPLNTIQDIQNKPFVWVIRQNKIIKVNVQVLEQRYNQNTAVIQGLETGDQVSRIPFTEADLNKPVTVRSN
ncbi:efflux RND transporter periplasmic adaptor subunit [Acinetobacter variabilis]|uniref:efflux RND transporter periplasmic adaptor subunit n=1 Tax=Acinetobacter variabilis TaxID=70346 RepID=UPI0028B0A5A2|nr:efflux RND transporter periplasmic adaptor subunit [Acinetobacter variabilis]